MSCKQGIVSFVILILACNVVVSCLEQSRQAKVVFLRKDELLTANADGSDVRLLVKDNVRKADPQWATDGERVVYRIDGDTAKDPKTHANLVVIDSRGSLVKSIPVLATEADGTIVGGMRFVEESGWHDNATVFASGSANPSTAEYRIIDVETARVIESYFGTGFATCPSKAQVAYATLSEGTSGGKRNQVEVNGVAIYSGDSPIQHLQWSNNCNRLAFTEGSETRTSFVVVRGATVETKLPLRADILGSLTVTGAEDSFLLEDASGAALYEVTTQSLRAAPAIAAKVNREKAERKRVLEGLGGSSANWWPTIR